MVDLNDLEDSHQRNIFGSEVVLPIEVAFHMHHLTIFQEKLSKATFQEALDSFPLSEVMHSFRRHYTNSVSHGSTTSLSRFTLSRSTILSFTAQRLWRLQESTISSQQIGKAHTR